MSNDARRRDRRPRADPVDHLGFGLHRLVNAGTAGAVESSWMSPVLKTAAGESSEEKELDFELAYQRSLTTAQRFEMMIARSRQIAEELIRRGHRKPVEVAKRP